MSIDELTSAAELATLLEDEKRGVILDFWGTWCQPCRSLRPHLEQLAADQADHWRVVAVHAEANEDLVAAYGIQATPTLIYLYDGAEIHRSAGAITPSSVATAMSEFAS